MGLRDMYYRVQPQSISRDKFAALCKRANLSFERKPNYRKTTDSSGVVRFDNLLIDLEITRVNQVWQSDITYYEVCGKILLSDIITNAFTRIHCQVSVSFSLKTEQTTLPALQKAVKFRISLNMDINNVILHSDGGGQYYDKNFLLFTARHSTSRQHVPISMGKRQNLGN